MKQIYPLTNLSSKFRKSLIKHFLFITILLASFSTTYSQNTLDNAGLSAATPASAAFSIRQLSSTYAGPAINVRRSSDNTTQDIGFTAGGDLDEPALLAFVGLGNGFVTTWYDQSGNGRNVTQATIANQPRIVNAGVLEVNGTRPSIRFGGASQNLSNPFTAVTVSYPVTMSVVANTSDATTNGAFIKFGNTAGSAGIGIGIGNSTFDNGGKNLIVLRELGANGWAISSPTIGFGASTFTSTTIQGSTTNSTQTFLNGASITLANPNNTPNGTTITGGLFIGGYTGRYPVVKEAEIIIFASALSTNDRQALECNQAAYYNISIKSIANQVATTCSGTAFNVAPTALPGTTYTWSDPIISPVGAITGGAAEGTSQTSISQTLTNITTANATATYTVTPSTCGGTAFTVVVTVKPTPVLSSSLTPPARCSNVNTLYTATSATGGTTYSWTRAVVAGISNAAGSGSSGSITENLVNTTTDPVDVVYVITLTAAGCSNVQNVTVTINPKPVLSSSLTPAAVCTNTSFNYTPASATTGTTFTWSRAVVAGISNLAATGTDDPNETLINTTVAPINVTYVYTLSANGCTNTQNVVVSVKPTPVLNSALTAAARCSNVATTYTATSLTSGTTFSWTRDVVAGISNAAGSGNGAAILETLINTTPDPVNVVYVITLTANGCSNVQNVTVPINPAATLSSSLTPPARCSGVSDSYTATSVTAGVTFKWTRAAVAGISNAAITTSQTSNPITETLVNTTANPVNVVYAITLTANGCNNVQNVTVTIYPKPVLSSSLTPAAICTNTSFNYTPASATTGTTFSWSRAVVAGISNAVSTGTDNPNETLINTTASAINVIYVYTLSANGCSNTQNVTVSVKPTPVLSSSLTPPARCSNVAGTYAATSATGSTTYSWTRAVVAGISNAAGSGSNGNITETLINTTTVPVDVVYVVTLTAAGCSNVQNVTVTINPTSTITLTSTAGTSAQSVCTNNPITDITYNIVGSGAAPTVSGLPPGVSYSFNAGVLTISGAPSIAGIFTYTITTAGPCAPAAANKTGTITVIDIASGTLTHTETSGIANNDFIICQGATVTFTATSGYNAYEFYVNGVVAQAANPSNIFSSAALANGDVVSVKVFNSLNCATFFNTVTISVLALPVPILVADKTSICPLETIVFTATPVGQDSYAFKVNGVQVYSGPSNTFTTSALTASQPVTVDITNSNNCIGTSAPLNITVNPTPVGTLTATENSGNIPNNNTICLGDDVVFTATGGNTYQFRVNGVIVQPFSISNTYTGTPVSAGPYIVQVEVLSANGCPATYPTQVINVVALPAGILNAFENSNVANDNTICPLTTVNFIAAPGFSNYEFKLNNVTVQNGSSNTYVNSSLVNNDIVTVEVTNASGCKSIFNQQQITVVPLPSGTLTASANPICLGSNVTFTATAGFANYIFSVNGTAVQNSSSNTYSSSLILNGQTVSVSVTNISTCSAPFNDIVMNVNPLPTGSIVITENSGTSNNNSICIGDLATFTATAGFSNYDFRVNTVSVQNGASNIFNSSTLPNGASITVEVTDVNGCKAILSAALITVTPLPVLSAITGSTTFCANSTTTLSSSPTGGVWSSSNTAIATINASTGVVTGIAAGSATITYTYTNANGCTSAVSTVVTTNPFPLPTLSGPNPICPLTSGNIYTTEAGQTNYVWTVVGGTIDNGGGTADNFVSVTWTNATLKTINVNYTNSFGCTSSTSATFTNAPTTPPPTITGTNIVCVNTTGIVYTTEAGKFNYAWTVIGGTATAGGGSSENTITITWNTAGTQSVSVNYNEAGGCTAASPTVWPVTVNPLPTASIGGTIAVCENSTQPIISFIGMSGTAPYTFTYTINGGANQTIVAPVSSITIPVSTTIPGTYIYSLVSVQDGSSTSCSQLQSGSATVTVNPLPTLVITNPSIVCTPASVNLTLPAVTATSTPGLTFTYWTNAAATIAYPTPTAAAAGTYYIKGTTAAGCYVIQPVVVTQNPLPTASISGTIAVCENAPSPNITFTGASGTAPYTFTYKINGGANQTIIAPVNSVTIPVSTVIPGTYIYSLVSVQDGSSTTCSQLQTGSATVTVNPLPSLTITNPAAVCAPATVNLTLAAITAGSTSGLTYTYWTDAAATSAYATPSTAGAGTYYIKGTTTLGCSVVQPVVVTVNALPATPLVTPVSATFCLGNIQPLSAGTTFNTSTVTKASGTINVAIPDNNTIGAANTQTVAGVPVGAVINSISVTFNITHAKVGDLIINLKAPNGNILNLVNREGGIGANFTNTVISSNGVTSIVGQAPPFTGTYIAEATVGASGATTVPGNVSNTNLFSSLYDTPNGDWILSARDAVVTSGGTINNWTIAINYTVGVPPILVTWSPTTDLFTDPAATIAYTGQSLATVYAKPASAGTKIYNATATNAAGCTSSASSTLTVNPVPVVTIVPDYCTVPGKVRLTASSVPAGATFVWSTGQTGSFIDVDIADTYDVVASFGTGCSATATSSVAEELVVNGDFTNGNTGFISDYNYKPDLPGVNNELVPDGGADGYGVGTNGQNYHGNFWGLDHTNNQTGERNYMLVNGHGSALRIWETTVNVLPNTTYYFSAWGMSLNAAGPFARLQFKVNGALVGSVANLATGVNSNANNGWTRFYGTWTSGPSVTNAVILINNLENAAGGNDFGLDDISFGTLSTFITIVSPPATNFQTICANTPIVPIEYDLGGSGSAPIISALPAGITASYNGVSLIISGTPTVAGNYAYSITTTGCNPFTATGTITVQSQVISLSSGNSNQTKCLGDAIDEIKYTIGGLATGASLTAGALPAGVTGSFAGNIFTIAGTPTETGIFNYTITTSGGCSPVSVSGTITVQEQTITNTSGSTSQVLCLNSTITPIIYAAGPTVTGATVTGLPPGVTGQYISNTFVISGTPTMLGTYLYTITTSGTCNAVTSTGTIDVQQETIALASAQASQNICIGSPMLNIIFNVGGLANNASVIGLPTGVTGVYNAGVFTISGTPTQSGTFNYTVTTSGGGCAAPATATGVLSSGSNIWSGITSSNWSDASNWACGTIPITATNVVIPSGALRMPQLTATSVCKSLLLSPNTSLDLNGHDFTSYGAITGTGVLKGSASSGLTLNAVSAVSTINFDQTTDGVSNALNNLTITGVASSVTLNNKVVIYDALLPDAGTLTLNAELILRSTSANTARVGVVTGTIAYSAAGKVTVERYLLNARKWRLLSAPTNDASQSIKSSWLENGVAPASSPVGYGFLAADTRADFAARGFDVRGNNSSIKIYNGLTDTWDAVDNAISPIKNNQGYIAFVPGDRKVVFPNSNPTTLRTKGQLYVGTQTINVTANQFAVVGNPYASRIDLRNINKTNIDDAFYVWDPSLGGSYGLGAFNTLYKSGGDYKNLLNSAIYGISGTINNDIESGMAFMVKGGASNGSITFDEADKSTGSSVAAFTSGAPQGIRINLNLAAATPLLLDGAMVNFDDSYSNLVDQFDIRKMATIGESVALKTSNTLIVIERRFIPAESDTLQIDMTKMTVRNYQWEIISDNMDYPGRQAYLLDRYLNTSTPLNMAGTTTVNFSIQNIPGSYAPGRFQIVFKIINGGPVPVTITSVAANRNSDKTVTVVWKVQNELNLSGYEVQRSVDGINFTTIITQLPNNNNGGSGSYQAIDRGVVAGELFYRIKANSLSGQVQYSAIVKVSGLKTNPSISIYPNPVEGKQMNVKFSGVAAGTYRLLLISAAGQTIYNNSVQVNNAGGTQMIQLNNTTASGRYQLIIISPDGTKTNEPIIIK